MKIKFLISLAIALPMSFTVLPAAAGVGSSGAELSDLVPAPQRIEPATYGTTSATSVMVGAGHFLPSHSGVTWGTSTNNGVAVYETSTSGDWWANVQIPNGADIVAVELEACDTDDAGDISFGLAKNVGPASSASGNVTGIGSTTGAPGCGWFYTYPTSQLIANNYFDSYFLFLDYGSTYSSNEVVGIRVYYRLRMADAPSYATFYDVPTYHWAFQGIEALAASGITQGCDAFGNFCPDANVTRAQMALFLARSLGLHFPN